MNGLVELFLADDFVVVIRHRN